jgi:ornithine cyclodeaminase
LVEIGHLFTSDKEELSQYPPSGYNIVFKCVGMGIMDLTVSNALLQMAIEKGLGLDVANL